MSAVCVKTVVSDGNGFFSKSGIRMGSKAKDLHMILDDTYIFMQDNAEIHRPTLILPDLNPIEHGWVKLKELLHQKFPKISRMTVGVPRVKGAIGKALCNHWEEIPDEFFDVNLIESMPRWVIKADKYTKDWLVYRYVPRNICQVAGLKIAKKNSTVPYKC